MKDYRKAIYPWIHSTNHEMAYFLLHAKNNQSAVSPTTDTTQRSGAQLQRTSLKEWFRFSAFPTIVSRRNSILERHSIAWEISSNWWSTNMTNLNFRFEEKRVGETCTDFTSANNDRSDRTKISGIARFDSNRLLRCVFGIGMNNMCIELLFLES